MFPANIYAALHDVQLGGRSASPLWWRAPLQLFWMATLSWSTLARTKLAARGETQPA